MRYVLESKLFDTNEDRINGLSREYASHLYVQGTFTFSDNILTFIGMVTDNKTEIRVDICK